MATIEERIAALEAKLKQEKAKKQQIEARKRAAESKANRSNDTRRKILLGALLSEMMGESEQTKKKILERLDKYLTRPDDRKLFDLAVTSTPQAE